MKFLLTGAQAYQGGKLKALDIAVENDRIIGVGTGIEEAGFDAVFHVDGKVIVPGFVDVHVHLREPGFLQKETVATGTLAAARGGYTAVCSMPNLNPAPDSVENIKVQQDAIDKDALIHVYPYAAITIGQKGSGELTDIEALSEKCIAFSDDGKGVQKDELMLEAMKRVKNAGSMIAAHCEDESLLNGGYIHDGLYARENKHRGICSESEWGQVKRDLELVRETGCRYHVCHVSTKETVELIRQAKAEGLPVTCETGPHYLTMCDRQLKEEGRFKMNPPIRSSEDRDALVQGLIDGTVDIVATDHAPHTAEEKAKGLEKSLMGVVGIETAFPILYTNLVMSNIMPLETLIDRMAVAPRRAFGIEGGEIEVGAKADLAVLDLKPKYVVNPDDFLSKGKATPFEGWLVYGENTMTIVDGKIVWQKD